MRIFSILLFILFQSAVYAQQINQQLTQAFNSNKAQDIAVYFDKKIDMSLPNQEGVYSKIQAEQMLKKFLNNNPVTSFKFLHSGNAKNNIHYSIGAMQTKSHHYRVYIKYTVVDKSSLIQEFKIELDE